MCTSLYSVDEPSYRKDVSEKPVQTIIPRDELLLEQPERRPSPRPSSEKIPQDSAPEAPKVGNKPKKAAFRENGGTEKGNGMNPNEYKVECSPDKVGDWF